jgi:hypothetical protein
MKIVVIIASLFSVVAFAERSPSTRDDSNTLYCGGTYSSTGSTRNADGVVKVKKKFWRKQDDSKHAHFIDRDGAEDGFEGLVYLNNCQHGGFTSPTPSRSETQQNKSKN